MDVRGVSLAVFAAFFLGTGWTFSQAQSQAKRRELGRIQKELEKTRAELEQYRKQEAELSRDLHKLESHNAETRKKISSLQKNINDAENKKQELKSRVGALNLASEFWKSVLFSEMRNHAVLASVPEDLWGTRLLWKESLRRNAMLEKVRVIAGLKGVKLRTEAAQEDVRRKARDLIDKNRKAKAEERTGREEYERAQAAVTQTREKVAEAEKRAKELEESKLALTQLLRMIGQAGRYVKKSDVPSQLEIPRNSLPWPVEGSVIRPFGRERNQELKTWVIHQGVSLATTPSSPVRPVESGRVIYAGPFRSYGKVIILDHGSGFFSIYGELGEILAHKGDSVSPSERIAVASAADGKGVLYLEIRKGTEALDPMLWLRKK